APESANNATVGGAMIPLLILGIPGSPTIAIVMGGFIIQGIDPGPKLFETEINLVYGILFGFLISTIFMYLIGRIVTSDFSRVLAVPNNFLVPLILILSTVGVYVANNLLLEVLIVLII